MAHGHLRILPFATCTALTGALLLISGRASAAEPKASVSVSGGTDTGTTAETDSKTDPAGASPKWFRRYRPRPGSWELGVFGGVMLPSPNIELYRASLLDFGGYDRAALDLGVRAGYYPLRHFGLEGELAFMPAGMTSGGRGLIFNARAHGILQLGIGRVVPFAVLGAGALSVTSEANEAGRNVDESLHVGGGVKLYATRNLVVRLDVRDIMSPREGITRVAPAHNPEVLLGLSWAIGPKPKPPQPPADTDGDGFVDAQDACPAVPGVDPDGCPPPDTDDDGVIDAKDACRTQAGPAPDGCPIPDSDGDGYLDPDDGCPEEVGVNPDGCPIRDPDGDGLIAPQDACPEQPETPNGFEDGDGCPDELPAEVAKFSGVIEGIYFDTGKSTIRKKSFPLLDEGATVLTHYPALRVRISGHTDNRGKHDYNVELSLSRANAVKEYLVGKGIASERIETLGAGPDAPVETNDTADGRAKNRRIEFEILR
jgi:outer membrane protein OmpA-like peptidoglycan-associated protein